MNQESKMCNGFESCLVTSKNVFLKAWGAFECGDLNSMISYMSVVTGLLPSKEVPINCKGSTY